MGCTTGLVQPRGGPPPPGVDRATPPFSDGPVTSVVALSFGPRVAATERARVIAAAARALTANGDRPARALPSTGDEHLVVADETDLADSDRFVVALTRQPSLGLGTPLHGEALHRALASGDDILARFSPPFAACWRAASDQPIVAATDVCGARHVYWWQGDGWAALSTSSLVLGRITGADLDECAVGAVALVGYHVGLQSSFRGIRKLGPGERCDLHVGRAELTTYAAASDEESDDRHVTLAGAADAGRSTLSGIVGVALDASPHAAIELSGGIDCRAVLAAIPPARRAGMPAYTLGPPDSPDARIARHIACRWRMDHRLVDTTELADLGIDEAMALVEQAGRLQDFGRDPVQSAVLRWVEAKLDQGPRFTGLNGEFARGNYYTAQREHPRPSHTLLDRLVSWRMFLNNAADPAIFAPDFIADSRADTMRVLRRTMESYRGSWLGACDEIYLRERIHRWAGPDLSVACTDRVVLAPYLQGEFLQWVRRTPPSLKRGSRAFAAVLERLDADLAREPLDSGAKPRELAHPGVRAHIRRVDTLRRKASAKVGQRVSRRIKSPVGAPRLAALLAKGWRANDGALDPVAALPFVNAAALHEIATGRRSVDAATVGFLAGLSGTLDFVRR